MPFFFFFLNLLSSVKMSAAVCTDEDGRRLQSAAATWTGSEGRVSTCCMAGGAVTGGAGTETEGAETGGAVTGGVGTCCI